MIGPVSRRNVALATLLGLAAALLVYLYLTQVAQQPIPPVQTEMTTALAAAATVPPNTVLTSNMLSTTQVRLNEIQNYFRPDDRQAILNQVVVQSIPAGRAIRREDIKSRLETGQMTFLVPKGMRAVAVPTNAVSGVAGFLNPGDRVDVLGTFNTSGRNVTKTVLQNVEVLAVGRRSVPSTPPEGSKAPSPTQDTASITLAVTPSQSEKLVMAADMGKIHLSLRAAQDQASVAVPGVETKDVVGAQPEPAKTGVTSVSKGSPSSIWGPPFVPPRLIPSPPAVPSQPVGRRIPVVRGTTTEQVLVEQ